MFDETKHAEYETENLIRKQQYENHLQNNRFTEMVHPLITRSPFNFIEVPTFGVTLHPSESVILPIKFHLTEKEIIKVDLHCQFGSFSQDLGNDWREVAETNLMMEKMRYSVKVYDARPVTDIVTVTVVKKLTGESLKTQFPVTIKKLLIPNYPPRYEEIPSFKDSVTIVIKTFMRYKCLDRLLDSIELFFPGTQVIVADDTPDELFEAINPYKYPFLKQYKMPPATGFFPGRALAISQVSTEYFISMDDDFTLTAYTKLDEFLKVIDESGYDMIGGPVETPNMDTLRKNPWADYIDYDRFQIGRSPDGFCYFRGKVPIAPLTNFPNCQVKDIIKNYFIARTSTVGRVRMDPHVTRSGHKEFFVDALGELRIASCDIAPVFHNPKMCSGRDENYKKFRYQERFADEAARLFRLQHDKFWYHRSYLRCYQEKFPSTQ